MTDFLSRLVDRSLGQAPLVKPLIAPQFAPGAEIFGPDATTAAVTLQEGFERSGEQSLDTASSGALPDTASGFSESRHQPAKVINTPAADSDIEEGLHTSFIPHSATSVEPIKSEKEHQHNPSQPINKPVEVTPVDEIRKDLRRRATRVEASKSESKVQREPSQLIKKPGEVRPLDEMGEMGEMRKDLPRPGSYSDNEESLTVAPLLDRAAKNSQASVTEQKAQQRSSQTESRRLSQRDQAQVNNTKDANRLEQTKIVTPQTGDAVRESKRPSPVPLSDVRAAKQRSTDRHGEAYEVKSTSTEESPALQEAHVFGKGATPVAAIPVENGSSTARIVRPEKVTARGRADSPFRTTTTETRSSMQNAPTVKVTIGRIEVRATLPPAPHAQETELPSPRMSLDDYLKSVSGERR